MTHPLHLAGILALWAGIATAQTAPPGANFMTQWDLDGDGQVTLAEARERRDAIFSMFDSDSDSDDQFSDEELTGIDAHKLMELEAGMGPGHQRPEAGVTPPPGRGAGNGNGAGKGAGMGAGRAADPAQGFFQPAAEGIGIFDADRDGRVSRAEFVAGTEQWLGLRDRDGNGVLSPADFGPPRG